MIAEASNRLNRAEVERLVREVLTQRLRGQITPPPATERWAAGPRQAGGPPHPLVVNVSARHMHVTQADLDRTVKDMTAEVFHVEPNYKGVTDLSDFTFAMAATAKLGGANAAVDSIRRSTELDQMGLSDDLIPAKAAKP